MKQCFTCKIWKEDENFHKCSAKKDGLHSNCKFCTKEKNYLYNNNIKNKITISENKKQYYLQNKDTISKTNSKRRKNNIEAVKKIAKSRYENNKEDILNKNKKYRNKHIQKIKRYKLQWDKENIEKVLLQKEKYYTKYPEKVTDRNKFRDFISPLVLARDKFVCKYCGVHGVYLNAHHISPWSKDIENRFNLNNCITLCKECHKLAHNDGKWSTINEAMAIELKALL